MKSRRHLIANILADMCKATFVAFGLGKVLSPDTVTWEVLKFGIIFVLVIGFLACLVQPDPKKDKE